MNSEIIENENIVHEDLENEYGITINIVYIETYYEIDPRHPKYRYQINGVDILLNYSQLLLLINNLDYIEEMTLLFQEKIIGIFIRENKFLNMIIRKSDGNIYYATIGIYSDYIRTRMQIIELANKNNDIILSYGTTWNSKIIVQHSCGHEPHSIDCEHYIIGKRNCPVCINHKIIPYINDCYTLRPDLIEYFENPQDAVGIAVNDTHKRIFVCPICGRKKENDLHTISRQGFHCDICSDGYSYSEKFMASVFDQIGIKYKHLYRPDWCKYEYNGKIHAGEYDFLIYDMNMLIEMDGQLHFINDTHKFYRESDPQNIDFIKDKLAIDNGYTIIRINCDYKTLETRFEYIKSSIILNLSTYFCFDNVDWNKASISATSTILIDICELWKNGLDRNEISQKLDVTPNTVSKYLNIGSENNMILYNNSISLLYRSKTIRSKMYYYGKLINSKNEILGIYYDIDSFVVNYYIKHKLFLPIRNIMHPVKEGFKLVNELMYCLPINENDYIQLSKSKEYINDTMETVVPIYLSQETNYYDTYKNIISFYNYNSVQLDTTLHIYNMMNNKVNEELNDID